MRRRDFIATGAAIWAGSALGQTGALAPEAADDEADILLDTMAEPWSGDLDGILARGFLRVGVPYGVPFFVADGPRESGLTVEIAREFQARLRETLGAPARTLTVVLAPLPRDLMLPALESGKVDLLAANLTVTPLRLERVDFGDPIARDVRELLVTGPATPAIAGLADLHAVRVHVRPSSSYFEHLTALDAQRRTAGQPPLRIEIADENLEDEDIAELLAQGVLEAAVMDEHKATLFAQIFDGLTVRTDIAVAEGGDIAWAMRQGSPKLMAAVNDFMARAKQGTAIGNTLMRRYYADTDRARKALDPEARSRFADVIALIEKHAEAYEFDALLIAAQGFQESGLDQGKRSPVGAIGVMQVMPNTARDANVGIPDIHIAERNVEAGVKYLRFVRDRYYDDPAISAYDKLLFSFAAYNAGPGNVNKARKRAAKMGLNPDVWFGNVELAMAKAVSREPVVYVRNILKYYVTYRVTEARKAEQP